MTTTNPSARAPSRGSPLVHHARLVGGGRGPVTASRINKGDTDGLDLVALLDRIEKELPKALPEVQWTMNNTLGAIGIHHAELRERAVAIGEKIGLYRDWPVSKGCIPPFVPVWVGAMVKRKG